MVSSYSFMPVAFRGRTQQDDISSTSLFYLCDFGMASFWDLYHDLLQWRTCSKSIWPSNIFKSICPKAPTFHYTTPPPIWRHVWTSPPTLERCHEARPPAFCSCVKSCNLSTLEPWQYACGVLFNLRCAKVVPHAERLSLTPCSSIVDLFILLQLFTLLFFSY